MMPQRVPPNAGTGMSLGQGWALRIARRWHSDTASDRTLLRLLPSTVSQPGGDEPV